MKELPAVETISEFLDRLASMEAVGLESDSVFFYRGQADKAWPLVPSLFRSKRSLALRYRGVSFWGKSSAFVNDEGRICAAIKRHFPKEFTESHGFIDDLAIMQHFGVPTRILDITRNSLVALYFASALLNDDSMDIPIHSHIGQLVEAVRKRQKQSGGKEPDGAIYVFKESVRAVKDAELGEGLSGKLAHPELYVGSETDKLEFRNSTQIKNSELHPVLVMPTFHVERQRRQASCFYLVPNSFDKKGVVSDKPAEFDEKKTRRILIKGSAKKRILEELELRFGITRSFLFPESISDYVPELISRINRENFADNVSATEYSLTK